jgi:hypothetical protein
MRYRKLDANGDYTFGGNANDFVTGELAVAEAVKTNLLLLSGEWWEDTSQGVPVFKSIIGTTGSPDNLRAVDSIIQAAALSAQGVIGISNYTGVFNGLTRTYAITCKITTQYGDATISIIY